MQVLVYHVNLKKDFEKLVSSTKQAGKIRRGEMKASRIPISSLETDHYLTDCPTAKKLCDSFKPNRTIDKLHVQATTDQVRQPIVLLFF